MEQLQVLTVTVTLWEQANHHHLMVAAGYHHHLMEHMLGHQRHPTPPPIARTKKETEKEQKRSRKMHDRHSDHTDLADHCDHTDLAADQPDAILEGSLQPTPAGHQDAMATEGVRAKAMVMAIRLTVMTQRVVHRAPQQRVTLQGVECVRHQLMVDDGMWMQLHAMRYVHQQVMNHALLQSCHTLVMLMVVVVVALMVVRMFVAQPGPLPLAMRAHPMT